MVDISQKAFLEDMTEKGGILQSLGVSDPDLGIPLM